jgi:hypothetical protein
MILLDEFGNRLYPRSEGKPFVSPLRLHTYNYAKMRSYHISLRLAIKVYCSSSLDDLHLVRVLPSPIMSAFQCRFCHGCSDRSPTDDGSICSNCAQREFVGMTMDDLLKMNAIMSELMLLEEQTKAQSLTIDALRGENVSLVVTYSCTEVDRPSLIQAQLSSQVTSLTAQIEQYSLLPDTFHYPFADASSDEENQTRTPTPTILHTNNVGSLIFAPNAYF